MTLVVTHVKVATNPQTPLLDHTDWNANHALTGVADPNQIGSSPPGDASAFLRSDGTWSTILVSSSANAFQIGPNGATNPALNVDCSLASANTGFSVIAGANSGSNTSTLIGTSPSSSCTLALSAKGSGGVRLVTSGGTIVMAPDGGSRVTFNANRTNFAPVAQSGAPVPAFLFTGAASLALSAGVDHNNVYFNMGQANQHAAGAITEQRDFRITPMTHTAQGASTIAKAAAFSVDSAPVAGTNVTITRAYAIEAKTGVSAFYDGIVLSDGAGLWKVTVNASGNLVTSVF